MLFYFQSQETGLIVDIEIMATGMFDASSSERYICVLSFDSGGKGDCTSLTK